MNAVAKALESLASFSVADSGYKVAGLNFNFGMFKNASYALYAIFDGLKDIIQGVK
ncbi:MAG: hypothetical protein Q3962_03850 [Corynebacterium sp.]|nr:hypothetical protein [Corynebacterium sp.]